MFSVSRSRLVIEMSHARLLRGPFVVLGCVVINPSDVTACLVTRGDQAKQMNRIRRSLFFENVVVWDNSVQLEDWKCAGRYKAAEKATTDIVYFQDDDVLVPESTQWELLQAYEPGVCVANWGHGENPDGYDDLPLVCGGAIVDRQLCFDAIDRYAEHWPLDDAFKYEADFVVGALYPAFKHLHLPFHIDLAIAQAPERLVNQPWQKDLKYEITQRARSIRDAGPGSAYLKAQPAGRVHAMTAYERSGTE